MWNKTDTLLVLCLLALLGCGRTLKDTIYKEGNPPAPFDTDSVFHGYLDRLPLTSITSIGFENISSGYAGVCTIWSNGYREIKIDKRYWDSINDSRRLELLAHEIGHCDYNLNHDDRRMRAPSGRNCPITIMNSTNFGDECFLNNFDYYMGLFDG